MIVLLGMVSSQNDLTGLVGTQPFDSRLTNIQIYQRNNILIDWHVVDIEEIHYKLTPKRSNIKFLPMKSRQNKIPTTKGKRALDATLKGSNEANELTSSFINSLK